MIVISPDTAVVCLRTKRDCQFHRYLLLRQSHCFLLCSTSYCDEREMTLAFLCIRRHRAEVLREARGKGHLIAKYR